MIVSVFFVCSGYSLFHDHALRGCFDVSESCGTVFLDFQDNVSVGTNEVEEADAKLRVPALCTNHEWASVVASCCGSDRNG